MEQNSQLKTMTRYAIIVAGGSGSRFGSAIPKQFLLLSGEPVLMHTIRHFAVIGASVVLVLPQSQISYWHELCHKYAFTEPIKIISGGDSRFHSVKNGLKAINATPGDIISVHDGVRPLISQEIIKRAYDEAILHGNAIPAVPVTDSIRETQGNGLSKTLDRSRLMAVQTPQAFDAITLKNAYDTDFDASFTDDASVVERAGYAIHLIPGDTINIKITHPGDIEIAEILLKQSGRTL